MVQGQRHSRRDELNNVFSAYQRNISIERGPCSSSMPHRWATLARGFIPGRQIWIFHTGRSHVCAQIRSRQLTPRGFPSWRRWPALMPGGMSPDSGTKRVAAMNLC
jgi:hypothetical protein